MRPLIDQQGRARAFRLAVQIRPDLGLEHHHQRRPQLPQNAAHGGAVIKRREEHAVGQARKLFVGGGAPGQRGRRDE